MQENKPDIKPENLPLPNPALPPKISSNKRLLVLPEDVSVLEIQQGLESRLNPKLVVPKIENVCYETSTNPISILWCPDELTFEIKDKPVTHTVFVTNSCHKIVLIRATVLWTANDNAEGGAKWYIQPKTVATLAPGMAGRIYITAIPLGAPPVAASANVMLQVTASYRRSIECCHFGIPINVEFLNYIPPPPEPQENNAEAGTNKNATNTVDATDVEKSKKDSLALESSNS